MHVVCQIFQSLEFWFVAFLIQHKISLISARIVFFSMLVSISCSGLFTYFNRSFHCDHPPEQNLISFCQLWKVMLSDFFHDGTKFHFSWISFRVSCKHPLRFIFINFFIFLKMKKDLIEITPSLFISSLKLYPYYSTSRYLVGKNSDISNFFSKHKFLY